MRVETHEHIPSQITLPPPLVGLGQEYELVSVIKFSLGGTLQKEYLQEGI